MEWTLPVSISHMEIMKNRKAEWICSKQFVKKLENQLRFFWTQKDRRFVQV